jgi:hypothetical protein
MDAYDYPAQSYAARSQFRTSSSTSSTLRTSRWCCQITAEGCAISLKRGDATARSSAIDTTTSVWGERGTSLARLARPQDDRTGRNPTDDPARRPTPPSGRRDQSDRLQTILAHRPACDRATSSCSPTSPSTARVRRAHGHTRGSRTPAAVCLNRMVKMFERDGAIWLGGRRTPRRRGRLSERMNASRHPPVSTLYALGGGRSHDVGPSRHLRPIRRVPIEWVRGDPSVPSAGRSRVRAHRSAPRAPTFPPLPVSLDT